MSPCPRRLLLLSILLVVLLLATKWMTMLKVVTHRFFTIVTSPVTTLGPFPLSLPSATIIINTSARGGKWRRWEGGRGKDVVGEEEV
uniref:Uncharacterized protein n=1 Tax=Oryza rufipogon TaxID=4529 RepID=A0A0E0NEC4_ORYRU